MATQSKEYKAEIKMQALNALAALGGEMFKKEDVLYEGNKLILPEGMTDEQAIRFLQLHIEEEKAETRFSKTFRYRPWDGGVALDSALEKAFGAVLHRSTPGFFGPQPPEMITIPVGVDETVSVPWGPLEVPLLPGMRITPGQTRDPEHGVIFEIVAEGPRKYRYHVEGIFNLVEQELKDHSIYRGKAFDGKPMPDFLALDGVDPDKIIFPEATLKQLNASVFARIRYAAKLEALGLKSKSAVLLHGPFGTGKTSTAYLVAKEAVENGRTFVYAQPGRDDLAEVFRTARLYQPSCVFCEDLDAQSDNEDRDSITELLDMFDGYNAKGTDILAILTTNYPENIYSGMLRPGRLDALIYLGAPDAAGVEKLVKINIPSELLASTIEWDRVAESMRTFQNEETEEWEHYLPAFVSEVSERAILHSVVRHEGETGGELATEDLVAAGNDLRPHWDMMQDAPQLTPADSLGVSFKGVVGQAVTETMIEKFNYTDESEE